MSLELHWVYWGLALQLPVYLVVMEELAKKEGIAALYVPLGLSRQKVAKPADAAEADSDGFYQKQEVRGIVDAEGAGHLDHAVMPHEDEGGKSAWFKVGFNKDGAVPKSGDMLAHGDFETVLAYVKWKVGVMGDDLMEGRIAPAPYREKKAAPCDDCDFASLCPFDRVNGAYRDVPKMKREEVIERMRATMGGG
jgi:ATP-dependent helicase/DNAse subunit B